MEVKSEEYVPLCINMGTFEYFLCQGDHLEGLYVDPVGDPFEESVHDVEVDY